MKEQLITFETAKLAKEKGFDYSSGITKIRDDVKMCTQSLLQKWLREKHNIEIVIHPVFYAVTRQDIKHEYSDKTYIDFLGHETDYHKKQYYADVQGPGNKLRSEDTYEQALEKGLQEAIKLIE